MPEEKKKAPPVADRLVYYAQAAEWPLFLDQHAEAHTLVGDQAVPISRTNRLLTKLLYVHEEKALTNDGLIGARRVLDMLAHADGDVRELHTRAAFHESAVFYQLAPGRVVRIDEEGWKLDFTPPVYFRAVKNLQPLPNPVSGGKLEDVAEWINLKTDRDRRLFLTYVTLVGATRGSLRRPSRGAERAPYGAAGGTPEARGLGTLRRSTLREPGMGRRCVRRGLEGCRGDTTTGDARRLRGCPGRDPVHEGQGPG
jgi:hypothetical protein